MIYLLTIGVLAAVMLGMAVGVMFAGKVLRGSCGGVGTRCDCSTEKRAECAEKAH
jgi:hypothetical protein